MGYAWLNLGSIIFGLLAWILPILVSTKFNKNKNIHGTYLVYGGLVSAILSLLFVITYRQHLISVEDWSALMDTKSGFQLASVVMSVVAITLNGLALGLKIKNSEKN